MSHQPMIKRWALFLTMLLFLVGCQQPTLPPQFGAALADKLDQIHSYQLEFTLESSGQTLLVKQWYQSPNRLRTDVMEGDLAIYRFLSDDSSLRLIHLPTGQEQVVALSSGNELLLSPLLLSFSRQAVESDWRQASPGTPYVADFVWTTSADLTRDARLTVDPASFLPVELLLFWPDQGLVRINFQQVAINPRLNESLFSAAGR